MTILIPTHNRAEKVLNSIEYYQDFDCDFIYVDSSDTHLEVQLKNNIQYFHVPKMDFVSKVILGIKKSRTDIISLCADDDLKAEDQFSLECYRISSSNCINVVIGNTMYFHENFDGKIYGPKVVYEKFNDKSSLSQTISVARYLPQILWATYKKDFLLSAFERIQSCEFSNENFYELSLWVDALKKRGQIGYVEGIQTYRELTESDHWGDTQAKVSLLRIFYQKSDIQALCWTHNTFFAYLKAMFFVLKYLLFGAVRSAKSKFSALLRNPDERRYRRLRESSLEISKAVIEFLARKK